jgi:salicylate hydroxylase
MIQNTIKWPLVSTPALTKWFERNVIVLGDAAHAMLPYMSQGTDPTLILNGIIQ